MFLFEKISNWYTEPKWDIYVDHPHVFVLQWLSITLQDAKIYLFDTYNMFCTACVKVILDLPQVLG